MSETGATEPLVPPLLLRGGRLVDLVHPRLEIADLRIAGGRIVERGVDLKPEEDETVVDCSHKTILPGMVNAHTHLYSSLARGMPGPSEAPTNFREILERVWWRLDRAHDPESIRMSTLVGAMDALRCGTTVLIDHHSSPLSIEGSLDRQVEAIEQAGVRAVLCYETTERNSGRDEAEAGLEENRRFLARLAGDTRLATQVRGLVGAHAAFTLSDDTLRELSALARSTGSAVHIHLAEDGCDLPASGPIEGPKALLDRLAVTGVLQAGTIFAHGTRLDPASLSRIDSSGGWLVHNTRSNMNNGVGYAAVEHYPEGRGALGTDGIGGDLFAEARHAFFRNQDTHGTLSASGVVDLIAGGHRLVARLFDMPYGDLVLEAPADLVILDYPCPTPLTIQNFPWHFIFGMSAEHVERVLVDGRTVWKDGRSPHLDRHAIAAEAGEVAQGVWSRIAALP